MPAPGWCVPSFKILKVKVTDYTVIALGYIQSLKQQSAIGHLPTNFLHLAKQIQFARPNLLYISNGKTIDTLLQCSCF